MFKSILFSLSTVLLLISCNEVDQNESKLFKSPQIGQIPNEIRFETLTKKEKKMVEILSQDEPEKGKGAFINNRSRIFLKRYENGTIVKIDSSFTKGSPFPCNCLIEKDTTFINMSIGFMGGMSVSLKIHNDTFESYYFEYTDDVKPYKSNLNSEFSDFVLVKSEFQNLIINQLPNQKLNQELKGYLSFSSKNYFESNITNKLDTISIVGKAYFKCKTLKSTIWN